MKLYYIMFEDGLETYLKEEDIDEFTLALSLLNVQYTIEEVVEPIYAIKWFDYIDDEWITFWCTPDVYEETLKKVIEAEVEYYIEEFNI